MISLILWFQYHLSQLCFQISKIFLLNDRDTSSVNGLNKNNFLNSDQLDVAVVQCTIVYIFVLVSLIVVA